MRIALIGTGSWGTAMAGLVASHGHTVVMWSYDPAPAHEINELHTNSCYLSDYTLPWGTAMAGLVASHGHTVVMWSYDPAPAHEINELHTNSCYLSDYTLPESRHVVLRPRSGARDQRASYQQLLSLRLHVA